MTSARLIPLLVLALLLAACNTLTSPRSDVLGPNYRDIVLNEDASFIEGELIVGYGPAGAAVVAGHIGATVLYDWPQIDAALLTLPKRLTVAKAEAILRGKEGVRYTLPNKVYFHDPLETAERRSASSDLATAADVDDPEYGNQWQHRQMNSEAAWDLGATGKDIRVGIHDSNPDHRHPDLFPNFDPELPGFDGFSKTLIEADTPHDGVSDHGSSVAGSALAAGNTIGGRGVAYEATHIPLAINDPTTEGNPLSFDAIVAAALFAVDGPDGISPVFGGPDGEAPEDDSDSAPGVNAYVHIVNMSWGSGAYDQPVKDTMDYMLAHGITLVTSAGNTPTLSFAEPAWHPGIITVAATNAQDERVTFSNRGRHLNVGAPGQFVWVTTTRECIEATPDGSSCTADDADYTYISGTSFSSPFTAGAAALILDASAERDADGNLVSTRLGAAQVRQILEETAFQPAGDVFNDDLGYGIVDAEAAVMMAQDESMWPEAGATLEVSVRLESNPDIGLAKTGLSLIALDDDTRATKYTQTSDGGPLGESFAWDVGTGFFHEVNPGTYRLLVSGPQTSSTGIPAAIAEETVTLEPGLNELTVLLDVDLPEDTNEPNDSVAEAAAVTAGTTVEAVLYNPDTGADIDLYALEVTADTPYRVNLESLAGTFDTNLRILDSDGSTVIAENDNNQDNLADSLVDFTAPADGTVYLEVTDISGSDSPFNLYAVDIATFVGDETEPNGSAVAGDNISNVDFADAQTVALGSALDARIDPATDADIYAVDLSEGTTVVVDLETAVNAEPDTMVGLYNADGEQVAFSDDFDQGGDESRLSYEVEADGTYYAVVVSWQASNTGEYGITITQLVSP